VASGFSRKNIGIRIAPDSCREATMPNQKERPRPHGDPFAEEVEPNPAQRQSDAPPDATTGEETLRGTSDRAGGRGSTANGIPEFDEAAGDERKKLYKDGAKLVSGID
jgi:hypothetical protein